jgi:hypothetical protein
LAFEIAKEKQLTYGEISIRLIAVLSSETTSARKQWNNVFQVLEEKTVKQKFCT